VWWCPVVYSPSPSAVAGPVPASSETCCLLAVDYMPPYTVSVCFQCGVHAHLPVPFVVVLTVVLSLQCTALPRRSLARLIASCMSSSSVACTPTCLFLLQCWLWFCPAVYSFSAVLSLAKQQTDCTICGYGCDVCPAVYSPSPSFPRSPSSTQRAWQLSAEPHAESHSPASSFGVHGHLPGLSCFHNRGLQENTLQTQCTR
jgi:hypothetical protein